MLKKKLRKLLINLPYFQKFVDFLRFRRKRKKLPYKYEQLDLDSLTGSSFQKARIFNILNFAKDTYSSDFSFEAGYQSIKIGSRKFDGRRDPSVRLSALNLDFKGKSVLDIGCNQGAILFDIANDIKCGIGVDYEPRMINICNALKSVNDNNNLDFFVFDIENDPLTLLRNFIPTKKIDVIFLMAVCQHVMNWKPLIEFTASQTEILVFESNGTEEQQNEQIKFVNSCFAYSREIYSVSHDDNAHRRLLIASNVRI